MERYEYLGDKGQADYYASVLMRHYKENHGRQAQYDFTMKVMACEEFVVCDVMHSLLLMRGKSFEPDQGYIDAARKDIKNIEKIMLDYAAYEI